MNSHIIQNSEFKIAFTGHSIQASSVAFSGTPSRPGSRKAHACPGSRASNRFTTSRGFSWRSPSWSTPQTASSILKPALSAGLPAHNTPTIPWIFGHHSLVKVRQARGRHVLGPIKQGRNQVVEILLRGAFDLDGLFQVGRHQPALVKGLYRCDSRTPAISSQWMAFRLFQSIPPVLCP